MRLELEFVFETTTTDRETRLWRDVFATEIAEVDPVEAPVVVVAASKAWMGPFEIRHHQGRFLRSFHVRDGGEYRPFMTSDLSHPERKTELEKSLVEDAKAPINVDAGVKRRGRPDPSRTRENDREERLAAMAACAGSPLSVGGVLFMPVSLPRWIYGGTRDSYGRDSGGRVLDWRRAGAWHDAVGLGETGVAEAREKADPHRGRNAGPDPEILTPHLLVSGIDGDARLDRSARELVEAVGRIASALPLDAMLAYADARDLFNASRHGAPLDDARLDAIDAMMDAIPEGTPDRPDRKAAWFGIDRHRFGRFRVPTKEPTDDAVYEGFTI